MKNIEEIIKNNKEIFNSGEPAESHFERFSVKLELRKEANKPRKSLAPYLLRAAVVTLLVTLSSLWAWDNFIKPDSKMMTLSQVSPQYREVENYYIHQVNYMENEIRDSFFSDDPEQKEALMRELQSMDTVYVALQKELKANPNDEWVINAMIEHYQKKLDVMTIIVNQLKAIRNINYLNNEDYETVSL
jgi:cytochrome c-type biogenesis protein CcmH/NrfG